VKVRVRNGKAVSKVLDSSALLALVKGEKGSEVFASSLAGSLLTAVNYSECLAVLARSLGLSAAQEVVAALKCEIVVFDEKLAEGAAALEASTRHAGLSLGDRACLALAARERLPAFTADRAWSQVKVGVDIRIIR
jgi:PIN domain nuclease of toxin-antitoxin system